MKKKPTKSRFFRTFVHMNVQNFWHIWNTCNFSSATMKYPNAVFCVQDFQGNIRRENPWNVTSNSLNASIFLETINHSRNLFFPIWTFNVPQELFNNIFETKPCSFFSTSHFSKKKRLSTAFEFEIHRIFLLSI